MATLHGPNGCPWDREQTHESLIKYLREEAREVSAAIKAKDYDNLAEELGDVLLQVLFHSQMAADNGHFTIDDVMTILRDKLVRRHPHVFGKGKKEKISSDEVIRRWKIIKAKEKKPK
ncbi:MAG: hypothetical protein COB53_07995 [Elusimicrobia bacterium]|nr:MAG: hypothetical protein COB53_07995 [Elusimicrobiota bacterium]